jgi:transglutaminase-like putative cysteine protease
MRREPEELAVRLDVLVDLNLLGVVPVDRALGDPRGITTLVLDARGEGAAALTDGPGQKVQPLADGVRVSLESTAEGPRATAADVAAALRETQRYPHGDQEFTALARRAVDGAADPREATARLLAFVAEFVEDSYAEADHVSARQVIAARRGDCSDHGLLFVTLARAVGVPARQVVGLLYLGDDARAFGLHEWCEVVLDGRWVAVDPTWNEMPASVARLRLSSAAAAGAPTTKFDLRVVEVRREGR